MKIESSNLMYESARTYSSVKVASAKFSISSGLGASISDENLLADTDDEETSVANGEGNTAQGNLWTLEDWQNRFDIALKSSSTRADSTQSTSDKLHQATLYYLLELLFPSEAKKYKDFIGETDFSGSGANWQDMFGVQNSSGLTFRSSQFVVSYTTETVQSVAEDTSFTATGIVKTSDGRKINFNINVGMSSRFETYYRKSVDYAAYSLNDPLILNFDTDATKLSDQTFYFDLDADGEEEQISMLGSGSGYLALDENGNGMIDDGSELFGTKSGDGFADLAAYDEDGNGWIDENDSVWSKLQIWTMDAEGNSHLYKLADKGVGAINLGSVSTEFALRGNQSESFENVPEYAGLIDVEGTTRPKLNGMIRSTGVFLYENGNVGTIQHVDLASYEADA